MISNKPDVLIVGGGVIGLSIAYYLSKKKVQVTLLEKGRVGKEASSAAAGMLGAQVESEFPGPMVELCLKSRKMFPVLSQELKEKTGLDIEWDGSGLLRLAVDSVEAEELKKRAKWQRKQGEAVEWWEREEIEINEPFLAKSLEGALYIPEDGQVSAPRLVQAYATGARLMGVEFLEGVNVQGIECHKGSIVKLNTSAGVFEPETVILTAGAWMGSLADQLGVNLPIVPVKGESLSLVPQRRLMQRTLFGKRCYLVPKADGQIIVGATEIELDTSPGVSAGAIQNLIQEACRLVPNLKQAEYLHSWSGIRPKTLDGLPYLGSVPGFNRLFVAGGHFRNGILLSAVTGQKMAELVTGKSVPLLAPFSPERICNVACRQ